jgi:prepilin-type processing-associated H-X9-DG protein
VIIQRRRAFTLFQLLVLLAVLALLFALFLPAVAKIREAAARTQSQNNLKQLALASHNYYDANGSFPPGVDAKLHFSATAYLLPYIEQQNVYNQIDFKKAVDDKNNLGVAAIKIKTLINPNDPVEHVDKDFGGTNYLFSAGSEYALKENDGVFFENSKIKFPDISDGTSNTIMIGETLKGDGMEKATDVQRQYVLLKKEDLKDLTDDHGAKEWKDGKNIAGDRCKNWMDGRFLQGTFTATRTVNDEKPDVSCGGVGGLSGLRGISKGVNVAMCDGSVRFVNMDVKLSVWKAIATRAGGEVVPNF